MEEQTFEQSMTELEQVVSRLESGDTTLDQSLQLFEQGIRLAKRCQQKLDAAEKRVKILTAADGQLCEKEFAPQSEKD